MRLGCCGELEQAGEIRDAGFDFLEVDAQRVLRGQEPSAQWDAAAPDPARLPLPIEAAYCLVPATMPIVGRARDFTALQDYIQRVAKRAQFLGIRTLVFGSGAARRRPEKVDEHTAHEHIREFVRMTGEVCAHHQINLAIEHLSAEATNTLNRLSQAREMCDSVGRANVTMIVDCVHFAHERESDQALLDLGDRVTHVHIAEPANQRQPFANGTESYDLQHFFCLLRKIGYNGPVSVEARWSPSIAIDGANTAALIRQTWEQASRSEPD